MAKNNNLTDFLTGVADAIRTKKGATELINPQDFESEILSIETGGGGTGAVLGELNVSSNGTYEAGSAITLVPGGLYQYKEVLPKETLAELYTVAEANDGILFAVPDIETGMVSVKIQKVGEEYTLNQYVFDNFMVYVYATGATTITVNSSSVSVNSGWNTVAQSAMSCLTTSIRIPKNTAGIPASFKDLLEIQFDIDNQVEVTFDTSATIRLSGGTTNLVKCNSTIDPSKSNLTLLNIGGYDEFSDLSSITTPTQENALIFGIVYRSMFVSNLQTDVEGMKYVGISVNGQKLPLMVYVEDPSKLQLDSGTAEAGCWYLTEEFNAGEGFNPTFVYGKDPVDGYNKVVVDVPSQAKLQSKTATSNGTYSADEGFDGLSQVTVDFALQNKTITANGTYTCDEGYGGLGQVIANVKPKLQNITITKNGNYTASTGYDGLKQVTVNVTPQLKLQSKTITANGTYTCDEGYDGLSQVTVKFESRTLFDNGKLAVHTVVGADNLSLDPNKATIEELIVNEGATSISNGTGYTSLKRVFLPGTLKSIGNSAFYECGGLTSVTIPDSVTSIGRSAFERCVGLTSITIPDSVTSIGDSAFWYCTGLTGVYISDLSAWCKIQFDSYDANPLYYAKKLYLNNELVTNLVVPDGITSIGKAAFYNCSSLTSVTIPDSVTSIEWAAFYECSGLTSITIPDSVTSIGKSAFSICNGLTSVTIGNSVTTIGNNAFDRCSKLTSIAIPNSVKSIGERAFEICESLTRVDISDLSAWCKIKFGNFSANPLYYAKKLYLNNELVTNLVIPDGVPSIGDYAFEYCERLVSATIPDSVTSIGERAFESCSGLTGAYINDLSAWCKIEFRDSYSNPLYYAKNLYLNNELVTDLVIPDSVTSINNYAFYNCRSIANVTIPDSVMSIGKSAFYNTAYYNNESNWQDDVLYIGKHLIKAKTSLSGDCVIKNSTLIIADYAFYNCSSLANVTIPDSVTSIGDCAFYKCSGLTSITLPFVGAKKDATNITYFGYIFGAPSSSDNSSYVPSSLKTVIITGGTSIRNSAFYNCSGLTSVTIPDSVTSIESSAFRGCSGLTNITIGNGVTSIGYEAFIYCRRLTSVTIMSTTPPTLSATAFTDTALTQIIVPAGCGEAYKTAANWSTYADYIIEEGMHRVTLGENVTCSVGGTSYSNQTFDVADQTVIHFEVGQPSEGGTVSATPDGIFLNGVLVSSDSEPATYDLTVTGNVSVTYSTGDVVGDITYNNCYKIVMN